jgi:hypothetical protein
MKEYLEYTIVINSQNNSTIIWDFHSHNLNHHLMIILINLWEQKILKLIHLILNSINSIFKLNLVVDILMMDLNNILIMIGKYYRIRYFGVIKLFKVGIIILHWIIFWLIVQLKWSRLDFKIQEKILFHYCFGNKNYPKYRYWPIILEWASLNNNTINLKILKLVNI